MADEPHDDANASQPGDPESSSDGNEMSDEHDAVATGFEVDDGEPQDFDVETGEYDAAPDEDLPDDIDDDLEGDESAEEFVLDDRSPDEVDPEAEQSTKPDDGDDAFHDEPVAEADMYDGGAPADEEPAEAVPEEADQSQTGNEPIDEADFADESPEMDDEAATSDLELEEEADEETLAAEASPGVDDGEIADDASEEPIHDEDSGGDDTDELPLQPELDSILDTPEPESVDVEPFPEVGPYRDPATLTLWVAGDEYETFAIAQDELFIGDAPSADAEQEEARTEVTPDIDLGPYVESDAVWACHAALYRHNKNYTLHAMSDGPLQINDEVLELGEHRRLEEGDVIVFGGEVGLEFNLPDARDVADHGATPESDADPAEESSTDLEADEAEVDLDADDEPEFTEEASSEETPEEFEEAELLDEQPDPGAGHVDTDGPPADTPPPPDESGGFDDGAADPPEDADAFPEEEWDEEPIEYEDDFA